MTVFDNAAINAAAQPVREEEDPMKRVSLVDAPSQAATFAVPAPGTPVYIAIDVARSKRCLE